LPIAIIMRATTRATTKINTNPVRPSSNTVPQTIVWFEDINIHASWVFMLNT
jgi:hypothetical protein